MLKLRLLLILLFANIFIALTAQTYHNYFSPQFGYYVQIGFGGKFIQFRVPNGWQTPFTNLNFIGNQNGLSYYGNSEYQVAITQNSSQVCVINKHGSTWFNYVGPVQPQNPYVGNLSSPQNNNNNQARSKCSWCNGTGRITKNDKVTNYGPNDYIVTERCNECGYEYYSTYTHHYHLDCGHCGGTGFFR